MTLQQISTPKINRGQISKIERGVQDPKLSTMNKIGDVLGFEVEIRPLKTLQSHNLEIKFKKFKKAYFKGRASFTGIELQKCKEEFLMLNEV